MQTWSAVQTLPIGHCEVIRHSTQVFVAVSH